MGRLLLITNILRNPQMLYYVKGDEHGRLCLYEAMMSRGGRRRKIQTAKTLAQVTSISA